MTEEAFNKVKETLLACADKTQQGKQPGYTGESKDVLVNFKNMAARFGVDPLVVWGIYFNKHVDAVNSYIKNPNIQMGETVDSRFEDLINYIGLGEALLCDLHYPEIYAHQKYGIYRTENGEFVAGLDDD